MVVSGSTLRPILLPMFGTTPIKSKTTIDPSGVRIQRVKEPTLESYPFLRAPFCPVAEVNNENQKQIDEFVFETLDAIQVSRYQGRARHFSYFHQRATKK